MANGLRILIKGDSFMNLYPFDRVFIDIIEPNVIASVKPGLHALDL